MAKDYYDPRKVVGHEIEVPMNLVPKLTKLDVYALFCIQGVLNGKPTPSTIPSTVYERAKEILDFIESKQTSDPPAQG